MKSTRGFVIYLAACAIQHTPALEQKGADVVEGSRHYVLNRLVGDDSVPDVGIDSLNPICDQDACPSSDEQVKDELIEALEADDKVNAVNTVELGALICDSLDEASDSTLLRFTISSTETVIAERTSYTAINGDVFTGGEERKVWIGDIVDPAPSEGSVARTVSMTWADACDVETFLLKVISRNTDGTSSIITSVPCSAGSTEDICMVEMEVEYNDESEPLVSSGNEISLRRLRASRENSKDGLGDDSDAKAKAEDVRLLAKYLSATDQEKESFHALGLQRLDGDRVRMPSGRKLTCSTQIDVMVLYSTEAMTELGITTAEQMETTIATAFATTNAAMASSEVPLLIELVHVAPLPYSQEGTTSEALPSLKDNSDVATLRENFSADLVQLVGSWTGTCGRGYIYNTFAQYGVSVVDAGCFDNFSHTHEIGHNMGSYHNREAYDEDNQEPYAHGLQYCTGTDLYRTVMSYSCNGDSSVPRVNYFSNPDVIYLDKPTGTVTEDNARVIEENMLSIANFQFSDDCKSTGDTCSTASECCVGTCSDAGLCETVGCTGDPHLVGFSGQKFDFTGEDDGWFALVSDGPCHITNIRITAPVPGVSEITYITGLGMTLCDSEGKRHSVEVMVKEPHVLETSCPKGSSCLAGGALLVTLDGVEINQPGQMSLGDGLSFSAANLPGACRSFGFEKYWLAKSEIAQGDEGQRRRLQNQPVAAVPMPEWILSDVLQTNPEECRDYVNQAVQHDALFAHQSEHTSMQVTSPGVSLRISHGKVHQIAMRDPTDHFDLPDHTAFQMNLVFEEVRLGPDPQGVVGETITPVVDEVGEPIMRGLGAIRGSESDYRVSGPFGDDFHQLHVGVESGGITRVD